MKLVISPHIDDEVYGCSSILDEDTMVYFCGINEEDQEDRPPMETRLDEAKAVSEVARYSFVVNLDTYVNHYYNSFTMLKDSIESMISQFKPEKIFIPALDFNQDHRCINEACMIALRPHDKNFFVPKILAFESVHGFSWQGQINANYFVPLDITKKWELCTKHESQLRFYRSPALMKDLASVRGLSAGVEYAEAFEVLRWVE